MSQIEVKSIEKSFGTHVVLEAIDLKVNEGEMVALVGPSGSGKTTLLNIIAGLLVPERGDVYMDGQLVSHLKAKDRGAVLVFQDYLLFPHLDVQANVEFGLKMRGLKKSLRKAKADALIELVQLGDHRHKMPAQLSGGQQQRVAIARALAIEPKVLLLDEPFSNLDQSLKITMRMFIRDLQKRLNLTCLMVTHDIEDAFMTTDKIAVLFDGEILQYDKPHNIYHHPISMQIAKFFGKVNEDEGFIKSGMLTSRFGTCSIDCLNEGPVTLLCRPEQIAFVDQKTMSEELTAEGIIQSVHFAGDKCLYQIDVSGHPYQVSERSTVYRKEGDRVRLRIQKEALLIFDKSS